MAEQLPQPGDVGLVQAPRGNKGGNQHEQVDPPQRSEPIRWASGIPACDTGSGGEQNGGQWASGDHPGMLGRMKSALLRQGFGESAGEDAAKVEAPKPAVARPENHESANDDSSGFHADQFGSGQVSDFVECDAQIKHREPRERVERDPSR
jgi:hypothetical protein